MFSHPGHKGTTWGVSVGGYDTIAAPNSLTYMDPVWAPNPTNTYKSLDSRDRPQSQSANIKCTVLVIHPGAGCPYILSLVWVWENHKNTIFFSFLIQII